MYWTDDERPVVCPDCLEDKKIIPLHVPPTFDTTPIYVAMTFYGYCPECEQSWPVSLKFDSEYPDEDDFEDNYVVPH